MVVNRTKMATKKRKKRNRNMPVTGEREREKKASTVSSKTFSLARIRALLPLELLLRAICLQVEEVNTDRFLDLYMLIEYEKILRQVLRGREY